MKASTLIALDQALWPVYGFTKTIARWWPLGAAKPQHYYVIKLFGLGSIVRIDHVYQNLTRKTIPYKLITLDQNRELCENLGISAFYLRSSPLGFMQDVLKLTWIIWQEKNVEVIDFERSSNAAGILRELWAMGKEQLSFSFSRQQLNKRRVVNIKGVPSTEVISKAFKSTYRLTEQKQTWDSETILVNINSGDYIAERRFPLSKFAHLIRSIHQNQPSLRFILTGSVSEQSFTEHFIEQFELGGLPIKSTAGAWDLKRLIEEMKAARAVITNDSSPLHLARYFQVPCIALWGPTSPKLVGYPDSISMLNIYANIDCFPCFEHPKSDVAKHCNGHMHCFQSLKTEEIAHKVTAFINYEG